MGMQTYHTWWTATITAPDGTRTEPVCVYEPMSEAQARDYLTAHLPPDERITELRGGVDH